MPDPFVEMAQEEADVEENARVAAEGREPPQPIEHTPLDVFGHAELVGSPPLPMGIFPKAIEDHACDIAERIGVDVAMVALPMLAVTAASIDDRIQVYPLQFDRSWTESARLWIAFVADAGSKKTPALQAALAPLRKVEKDWYGEDLGKVNTYQLRKKVHDKQHKAFVTQLAKGMADEEDEPEAPKYVAQRRRLVNDTTVEALSTMLVDNPSGMIEVHDELSSWFGNFDAYRPRGASKDRSLYLEAYNGGQQMIDRVSRGRIVVPNWSLSLLGGIQPGPMRRLAGKITDDGLVQRFIVVFTERNGEEYDRLADEQAEVAYARMVECLLRYTFEHLETQKHLTLSVEAHGERTRINRIVNLVSEMPWVSSAFRAHLAKWEGLFPRLLLTFYLADHHDVLDAIEGEIDGETAQRVSSFMLEYLLPHAARFYTETLEGKEEIPYARWIAGYILAHRTERISVRDIGRVYRELRGEPALIRQTMEYLAVIGWVAPQDDFRRSGPSKWKVNPLVHTMFVARADEECQHRAQEIEKIQAAIHEFPALNISNENGTH